MKGNRHLARPGLREAGIGAPMLPKQWGPGCLPEGKDRLIDALAMREDDDSAPTSGAARTII